MKISFFRALYGSCAGLAIFEKLQFQSFFRAVLHLLMMSIISSAIIAVGLYPALKNTLHSSLNVIEENCRGIVCTNKSIMPALEPERGRSFVINGPWAVTYLPVNAAALPDDFQQDCPHGVLWGADGKFVLWQSLGSEKYDVFMPSENGFSIKREILHGKKTLFEALKSTPKISLQLRDGEVEELTSNKLQALTDLVLALGMSGLLLRKTLLEVILYIGMFACVSLLMNIGRPRRMPFKEMIVLAIYAGLPPMLIGSIAEALQLPFLNFNMIYVLGMTLYLIVIMNRLERLRQERQWREEQGR